MAKRKNGEYGSSVYQSLTVIMQFGIYMLVPIIGMSALGYFIDHKLGTSWVMIVFFFVGAIAGAQNVYRLAMKIARTTDKKEDRVILNRKSTEDKTQIPDSKK